MSGMFCLLNYRPVTVFVYEKCWVWSVFSIVAIVFFVVWRFCFDKKNVCKCLENCSQTFAYRFQEKRELNPCPLVLETIVLPLNYFLGLSGGVGYITAVYGFI